MIIDAPQDKCSGYGLIEVISQHKLKNKETINALEIGCDVGKTSEFLLRCFPNLILHGVDPYINYIDWNGNNLNERNEVLEKFKTVTQPYEERVKLYRKTSDEAVQDFEDGFFDFIFIDGLHTYDQVKKDCENYYPKLKNGGLFSGHDFNNIKEVRDAVKEFAIKQGLKTINSTDFDVWYWWKN